MSDWEWWAGHPGEDAYDIANEPTREAVIRAACRELGPGDTFRIVEAKSSTAKRYEGADIVPFIRQRNHETVTVGPTNSEGDGT